jgi:hypothetical protein
MGRLLGICRSYALTEEKWVKGETDKWENGKEGNGKRVKR